MQFGFIRRCWSACARCREWIPRQSWKCVSAAETATTTACSWMGVTLLPIVPLQVCARILSDRHFCAHCESICGWAETYKIPIQPALPKLPLSTRPLSIATCQGRILLDTASPPQEIRRSHTPTWESTATADTWKFAKHIA